MVFFLECWRKEENATKKTTYLDGVACRAVRAGGLVGAGSRNLLRDRPGNFGAEVPAEDLFAGSFRAGQRGDGARGRCGSRKRGIHHLFAANLGESYGPEQKYRGGDAGGPEVSRRYSDRFDRKPEDGRPVGEPLRDRFARNHGDLDS